VLLQVFAHLCSCSESCFSLVLEEGCTELCHGVEDCIETHAEDCFETHDEGCHLLLCLHGHLHDLCCPLVFWGGSCCHPGDGGVPC